MNEQVLQAVMTHATPNRVAMFFEPLSASMEQAQISTPLRIAHFLAQVAQESGELIYTEEIASGAAYEGRVDLGNTHPGDGIKFKGRGLIQVTGYTNYAMLGAYVRQDLTTTLADAEQVAHLPLSCLSAAWYWHSHALNVFADADNILAITKRINGGTNGLTQRTIYLGRAKKALGI